MVSLSIQSLRSRHKHTDISSLRRRHKDGHPGNDPSWSPHANIKTGTHFTTDGHYHGLFGVNETNIHCRSMSHLTRI